MAYDSGQGEMKHAVPAMAPPRLAVLV